MDMNNREQSSNFNNILTLKELPLGFEVESINVIVSFQKRCLFGVVFRVFPLILNLFGVRRVVYFY